MSLEPFTTPSRRLEKRLRQTLPDKLRQEFGRRRGGIILEGRDWPNRCKAWQMQAGHRVPRVGLDGEAVVQITSSRSGRNTLWWGYTEVWQMQEKAERLGFVNSCMRFYWGSDNAPLDYVPLRLEWEGPQPENGSFVFPGMGAGHPHWQINTLIEHEVTAGQLMLPEAPAVVDRTIELLEGPEQPGPESDLGAPVVAPRDARLDRIRRWLERFHLPARANWTDATCDPMDAVPSHAHVPGSLDEIDNWVISALRYTKHEFQKYA